ncbi:MAG TPA: cell division protein FtsL [Thermoanaerobaculia bacterium]|nr:cell division protein FtsL [Thermoanaerobaculia bacterium]
MKTAYAFHRPVTNDYLVRERERRRWRDLLRVVVLIVPLGVALFSYTWIHLETVETGYRIDRLERQLERTRERERLLRLEAARLSSPSRVEEQARQRLGMTAPRLEQMIFVEEAVR